MTIRIDPSKTTRVNPSLGATQKMYPCWQPSSNYAEITIDHTQLTGDVTDLVIPLTGRDLSAGFWSAVDAAGLSIVVTDAHSNRILRRQVPHIDTVGETLEVYVRVPSISASMDTDLLLSVAPYTLAQDMLTWPSSWKFASDMSDDDAGTGIRDWSQYANHGTKGAGAAAPTEVAGLVGMAQEFPAGGYISLPNPTLPVGASEDFFICALVNLASVNIQPLYEQSLGNTFERANDIAWFVDHRAQLRLFVFLGTGDSALRSAQSTWVVPSSTNTFLSVSYHASTQTATFRINGSSETVATTEYVSTSFNGARLGTATRTMAPNQVLDEVYFSSVALSPDEMAAIDAALRGTATFYGVTNHF